MKKKFLALALAAAVMAPTTSAFAQTIQGNDTQTFDANVTISGTVSKSDGTVPSGKIEVELPTSASFSVDKLGNFTGSTFTISNRSESAVNVSIASFSEGNPNGGITINSNLINTGQADSSNSNHISNFTRDNIRLQLNATSNGQSDTVDLNTNVNNENLITIEGSDTASVQVLGLAGTKTGGSESVETQGASEEFVVKFKIKKA